jgi:hypothetical protein
MVNTNAGTILIGALDVINACPVMLPYTSRHSIPIKPGYINSLK